MNENAVEIHDLDFSYLAKSAPVLSRINLNIPVGANACVIGPNGGGKSTLLKLILGLLKPQKGCVHVFGTDPVSARPKVGYMPQYHKLDSDFPISVRDVVIMGRLRPFGFYRREDREKARAALAEVGVADLEKRSFAELSGGQRQRVLIARALCGDPELLLLDEPTANIDPGAGEQFYRTLAQLRKRMTLVTISHDLGFVDKNVDMVICVNRSLTIHDPVALSEHEMDSLYHHAVAPVHHCKCCGGREEERQS
ncbi:MAG: ABC transporter ATP-binding protein [Victivallaceae bacterium]|nr:ABC transporter ATP-binding protein [Victivallaceae bacterium]